MRRLWRSHYSLIRLSAILPSEKPPIHQESTPISCPFLSPVVFASPLSLFLFIGCPLNAIMVICSSRSFLQWARVRIRFFFSFHAALNTFSVPAMLLAAFPHCITLTRLVISLTVPPFPLVRALSLLFPHHCRWRFQLQHFFHNNFIHAPAVDDFHN